MNSFLWYLHHAYILAVAMQRKACSLSPLLESLCDRMMEETMLVSCRVSRVKMKLFGHFSSPLVWIYKKIGLMASTQEVTLYTHI